MLDTQQLGTDPLRLCEGGYEGGNPPRGFKGDEMSCGSLSGRTAEGTILEVRMTLRMVVMQMLCAQRPVICRAKLHQKRRTAGGHEPDGDIGTKSEGGQ